jgi:predicted nucleotidyltransferase
MLELATWRDYLRSLELRPLFVTVSGAHLYGFPSPDSDIDLRGCHMLPLAEIVGLEKPAETWERSGVHQGTEVDLVSHDVGKYLRLLVTNNGYILEQVFSPLVVIGQGFLEELRPIAQRCITRHHYHHYRGFYATQQKLLEKEHPKRAKTVLYAYRVLLTGIHLLRTGEIESSLPRLNEHFRLLGLDELIASKTGEKIAPANLDWPFHERQLGDLERRMDEAFAESTLPDDRDRRAAHDLLVRLRLGEKQPGCSEAAGLLTAGRPP